ncbi:MULTISPECIES: multidrug ABC transporter ATPase [unclassified Microbacterium]|uniref:multidrug ABC transporter ATPase n=1 Tax=unclassified Microbacterium TaxID=2609290 RepID=UPI0012FA896C|nr:multidrug ABC transporter ATPase [Microbacterium sp. MAH-37]MVQ40979.1 multidrug ABC transporter ATPase [Microbacterium sp. MAH-37]
MSAQRRRPNDGTPTPEVPDLPVRTVDKVLAYTALGLAGASVLCFFAIIIGTATGMEQEAFAQGIWPFVAGLPLYGLPIAFVMIIALLIMSMVRKGRAAKRS